MKAKDFMDEYAPHDPKHERFVTSEGSCLMCKVAHLGSVNAEIARRLDKATVFLAAADDHGRVVSEENKRLEAEVERLRSIVSDDVLSLREALRKSAEEVERLKAERVLKCGHGSTYSTSIPCIACEMDRLKTEEERARHAVGTALKRLDVALLQNSAYFDQIEWAWSIIASAGPEGCIGNWEKMDPKWKSAAEAWRDKWHELLGARVAVNRDEALSMADRNHATAHARGVCDEKTCGHCEAFRKSESALKRNCAHLYTTQVGPGASVCLDCGDPVNV